MGKKRETRKYRAEKQAVITRALRAGLSQTTAIALAGISRDTYYRWRREYPEFDAECLRAEHESLSKVEATVYSLALQGDLRACTWLLERRHSDYKPPKPAKEELEGYTIEIVSPPDDGSVPYKVHLAGNNKP